jgi:hypothetical protein
LTCGHFTSTAYKLRRQIFVDHGRRKQAFDSLYQRYQKAYKKMENNHDPDLPRFLNKQEFGKGDIAMFGDPSLWSRKGVSNEAWVQQTTQEAMQCFQRIRCCREELDRLRVEARRLRMWMVDEPNYMWHRIQTATPSLGVHGAWQANLEEVKANDLLESLDVWYAHERVNDLERHHAKMWRDLQKVRYDIPEMDICARREDRGKGSHWHNRPCPTYDQDLEKGLDRNVPFPPNTTGEEGYERTNQGGSEGMDGESEDEWEEIEADEQEDVFGVGDSFFAKL